MIKREGCAIIIRLKLRIFDLSLNGHGIFVKVRV